MEGQCVFCCATMLDVVGTPIGTMQSLLGHSAPEITREILLARDPGKTASCSQRRREADIWTQIGPRFSFQRGGSLK
jgi:hypothetical protein